MIKINLNNVAKVLKFIATVITSVLGTIAFLSCQDLLWRETAEGGHKMPGQGNQGLCRICQQRQESRGDGMQDALQQWIARRYGKQGQGYQKKHVQQG